MALITDRDLVAMEPRVFSEVAWASQRLLADVNATVLGTQLQVAGISSLASAGVAPGAVLLIEGVPMEVVQISGPLLAIVSRIRADATVDPAVAPTPVAGMAQCFTFSPQINWAHRQLLAMLGLSAQTAAALNGPGESSILNPRELMTLEACLTLHAVYSAVAAVSAGVSPGAAAKVDLYRLRISTERARVAAVVDTDGDGRADAIRRCNAMQLVRG